MDEEDRIDALRDAVENLPIRQQSFAESLIEQYEERGHLSDLQWEWVDRLCGNAG